jgi:hypothetical protein
VAMSVAEFLPQVTERSGAWSSLVYRTVVRARKCRPHKGLDPLGPHPHLAHLLLTARAKHLDYGQITIQRIGLSELRPHRFAKCPRPINSIAHWGEARAWNQLTIRLMSILESLPIGNPRQF